VTEARRRALRAAGAVARHLPSDRAKLFAFVASPAVRADPWSLYQRLHRRRPIRPGPYGTWLVASHEGVTTVLRHGATSVDESLATGLGELPRDGAFTTLMDKTLLFTDPPDHARLRRLVSRSFTPRTVEALRQPVEELVERSLAELRPEGSADLIADFALPFPVAVICELLGVPAGDRDRLVGWARHLAPRFDIDLFRDAEKERLGDQAATELVRFLDELIDDPARRDADGLIAATLEGADGDDRLQRDELVALCALLLVAGFETTTNLVANSVVTLFDHPEQLAALRDGEVDPAPAVEELLRHAGPVQFTQRVLLEDLDLDGHAIPARTLVALLLGAANRDPAVFAEPDRVDLAREPNPHLAFSSGIHHCLGAALARLEAQIAIPAILRTLPNLRRAAPPQRRDTFVLRGFSTVPVRWG
jgi:cytochrome P450